MLRPFREATEAAARAKEGGGKGSPDATTCSYCLSSAVNVRPPVDAAVVVDFVADPPGDTNDLPLQGRTLAAAGHEQVPQLVTLPQHGHGVVEEQTPSHLRGAPRLPLFHPEQRSQVAQCVRGLVELRLRDGLRPPMRQEHPTPLIHLF